MSDFTVSNEGSIFLVTPSTQALGVALRERVPEDAQFFGSSLVVEHRYIADLVRGLRGEGYEVLT